MASTVNEFRSALLIAFPDLAVVTQPDFYVEYVLEWNKKKLPINSNMELESGVLS